VKPFALSCAVLALVTACDGAPPREATNVVLILADDLGWADVGYQGSTFHATPNLDSLAAKGIVFSQAYSASPVCSPSRASILTGIHPARLQLTRALQGQPASELPGPATTGPSDRALWAPIVRDRIPAEQQTFVALLKDAGYRTGFVGKWHLGPGPLHYGFESQVGAVPWGQSQSYFPPYGLPGLTDGPPGEYLTDRLTDEAVRFLEESSDSPFFLLLSHYAVHSPWEAKPERVAEYEARADPDGLQRNPVYAAMVESLDDSVGRIVAALERLGLSERTVVVFTSDNGAFEEKRNDPTTGGPYRITSNLPLRSGKGRLYEGGVRVPTVVLGPVVARPGSTSDVPIVGTDLFPTILTWAGVSVPDGLDGADLAGLVGGGVAPPRDELVFHFPHQSFVSSIRRGDMKLIHFYLTERHELYDLAADPGEASDMSASQPELATELEHALFERLADLQAVLPTRNPGQ